MYDDDFPLNGDEEYKGFKLVKEPFFNAVDILIIVIIALVCMVMTAVLAGWV